MQTSTLRITTDANSATFRTLSVLVAVELARVRRQDRVRGPDHPHWQDAGQGPSTTQLDDSPVFLGQCCLCLIQKAGDLALDLFADHQ